MAAKQLIGFFATASAIYLPPNAVPVQLAILHRDCGVGNSGTRSGTRRTTHAWTSHTTPNEMEAGRETLVKVTGDVDKTVTAMHINASLDVQGVKFSTCEGDGTTDVTCAHNMANVTFHHFDLPIKQGEMHVAMRFNTDPVLTQVVPFNVRMEAIDENSEPFLCAEMVVTGSCGININVGQHVEAEDDVQRIGHVLQLPASPEIDQHPYHDEFCQQFGITCVEDVDSLKSIPSWGTSGTSDIVEIPAHAQKMAGSIHKILGVRGTKYRKSLVCHRLGVQKIGCHPEHDMVTSLWELTTEMSHLNSSGIVTGTLYMMCHTKACHVTQPGSLLVVPSDSNSHVV